MYTEWQAEQIYRYYKCLYLKWTHIVSGKPLRHLSIIVSETHCDNDLKDGAMHFIYYINRLTTVKVDSTYLG